MYTIYLINHGYEKQEKYSSFDDAVTAAKKTGFECAIYHNTFLVAAWGPISGLHKYETDAHHYA